jgi:hypothetical protein
VHNFGIAVVVDKKRVGRCSAAVVDDFGWYLGGRKPATPPPAAYIYSLNIINSKYFEDKFY